MKLSALALSVLMLVVTSARAESLSQITIQADDAVYHDGGTGAAHVYRDDSDYNNGGDAQLIQTGFGGRGGGGPVGGGGMFRGGNGGGLRGTGDGGLSTGQRIEQREGEPIAVGRPMGRPVGEFHPEFRGYRGEHFWETRGWRPTWLQVLYPLPALVLTAEILSHRGQWICRAIPMAGGAPIIAYGPDMAAATQGVYLSETCGIYGNEPACFVQESSCQWIQ